MVIVMMKQKRVFLMVLFYLHSANVYSDTWASSYALEASGQYEKAAAVILPELDTASGGELGWLRYGWLNYLQGNYSDSVRAYETALRRNHHSLDARLGMALPLLAQRRYSDTRRYMKQVLDRTPSHYTATIYLLSCDEGQRKWSDMQKRAARLVALYPSETMPWVYLARAENYNNRKAKAQAAYQQVLMRSPEHIEASRYLSKA